MPLPSRARVVGVVVYYHRQKNYAVLWCKDLDTNAYAGLPVWQNREPPSEGDFFEFTAVRVSDGFKGDIRYGAWELSKSDKKLQPTSSGVTFPDVAFK